MKSKVKQILTVLLTVCMLATVTPFNAYAAEIDFSADQSTDVITDTNDNADVDISEEENADVSVDIEEDTEEENPEEEDIEVADTEDPEEELFSSEEVEEFSADEAGNVDDCYTITKAELPQINEDFYKIMFIDCGRKYFSVDSLKTIIDNASAAGFNYIELGVGNDGLRLLLDDMSIEVNGKTYESSNVTTAIHEGNISYNNTLSYNPSKNELTQSEMSAVIAYAKTKNIGVIPLINTPGHMDAILSAANSLTRTSCSYGGSERTIDVTNATAVAFTQALVQKYLSYFAGQGCKLFNMGADEYANDKYTNGSMGFGQLQSEKKYSYYVKYINKMADMIKASGMVPMAFNDGIYFNSSESSGIVGTDVAVNTDIIVCYWSNGWTGYTPASASFLNDKGFKLINTHGSYYWVLGKSNWQCDASTAAGFNYKKFQGGTIENPAGAMFCIWCDYPGAGSENDVVNNTADTIAAFGKTLPETESVKIETDYHTVGNDGAFTVGSFVSLTLSDGSEIAAWNSSDPSVISLTGDKVEVASDETQTEDAGSYTSVTGTALKPGKSTITLTSAEGQEYTTVISVEADERNPEEKEITVDVNSTYVDELTGNYSGPYTTDDASIATVSTEYVHKDGESINYAASASASIAAYSTNYGKETYPASNLIDGDTTTKYWSGDDQTVGAYVQVNLGAAIPFDTVRLTSAVNSGDNCENADVLVSEDGTSWTKIGSYTGSTKPTTFTNTLAKVRYIQVKITEAKSNWWQVSEIEWGNTSNGTFTKMPSSGTVTTEEADKTNITFTGVSEGNTTVQIGKIKYSIHVVKEDINKVPPVKAEYWITNRQVTADGVTEKEIKATDTNVYSETGAKFNDLVPASGTYGDAEMSFWKGTLLTSDNKQTTGKGVNKTNAGTDFDYIRYWRGTWSVSADGKNWNPVGNTDQIVAYYLQVTDVTKEITTKVVDWGPNYSKYDSTNFVLMDYAVKYESGQQNPNSFPVSDKTLAFHCDPSDSNTVHQYEEGNNTNWSNYYREIGMIKAEETSDYEVYMITVRPSSDSNTDQIAGKANSAFSYSYAGTEKVIWVDDEKNLGDFKAEDFRAEGYHVGGEATVPGLKITDRHAMLVTYYVRAKVTADSLTVRYVDKTSGYTFYEYNVAVKSGTTFKDEIALPEGGKGNLRNGEIINIYGNTQIISSDLSTMPQIGADYRYSSYECESVTTSDDKKIVTLYYNFKNTHSFVVDYGLPLTISADDLGLKDTSWTYSTATTNQFGDVTLDKDAHTLTYTPTKVLKEAESINLTLGEGTDETPATHIIYIYPASTVYYEEGFADFTDGFTKGNKGTGSQSLESVAAHEGNYGYDADYEKNDGASSGEAAVSSSYGQKATFTFTGTGVDIYANCTKKTSPAMITIYNSDNELVKAFAADTKISGTNEGATGKQNNLENAYSVPIVSVTDLGYGDYTVNIAQLKSNEKRDGLNFDGFRVYNTLSDTNANKVYAQSEKKPQYVELRNKVLASLTNTETGKYADQIAAKTMSQVYARAEAGETVTGVVFDKNKNLTYSESDLQDLLDNGSKNELYLYNGQSIVINLAYDAQIGIKGVNGIASYTLNNVAKTAPTTDMFYPVEKGTVTITNTSDVVLSITKLKVCGGVSPTALFAQLTEESLTAALVGLGYEKAPKPTATATPTPTVTATAAPTQKPVQQIKLAAPKLGKVVSAGYNALKLNWSKVNGADGYRVYVKVNGQWKALGNTKRTTYVHKKLETGKSYTYTVKAYKNTKSGTVWSSYDKKGITGKAALSAPSLRKAKRISAKKATLSWKKVNGASGYVVYRKTNNGRWQIVKKITKGNITSFTDKKLSKGKKYTYTVRAYRTVGKKNIYSGYNKKGLKVK